MNPRTFVLIFLGGLTLLRLCLAAFTPLAPDEAYYYMWSERLDWSYYSKGPGIALAIRLGTTLLGDTVLGIRMLSPLLALGTSLFLFSLTARFFNQRAALLTVVILNITPIFTVGSMLMTIDPLSIFFWTAALWTFWQAIERGPKLNSMWIWTGLLVGIGFLCKWTNAIFLLSVLLFLILSARHRIQLLRPGFYVMLIVFGLCTIPPIMWNSQNDWITLSHLQSRGRLDSGFAIHPLELLEFITVHLGVYSPLVFIAIVLATIWGFRIASRRIEVRYLLCFGMPLIILYTILSLKAAGEANWTAPAFVSLGILTGGLWTRRMDESKAARAFIACALILSALMSLFLTNTDVLRMAGAPWGYENDPGGRLRGWETGAARLSEIRQQYEKEHNKKVFMIANRYQTAATLSFYMPYAPVQGHGHPAVYIPESQDFQNQFSFWHRYDENVLVPGAEPQDEFFTEQQGINPLLHHTALYVTDLPEGRPARNVINGFESWELIAQFDVERRGKIVKSFRVFACHDYQTTPL